VITICTSSLRLGKLRVKRWHRCVEQYEPGGFHEQVDVFKTLLLLQVRQMATDLGVPDLSKLIKGKEELLYVGCLLE